MKHSTEYTPKQCGICGACNSIPPWAPEALANATLAERKAIEKRMKDAQDRFIVEQKGRLLTLSRSDCDIQNSTSTDTSRIQSEKSSPTDSEVHTSLTKIGSHDSIDSGKESLPVTSGAKPNDHGPTQEKKSMASFISPLNHNSQPSSSNSISLQSVASSYSVNKLPLPDSDSDTDSFHTADEELEALKDTFITPHLDGNYSEGARESPAKEQSDGINNSDQITVTMNDNLDGNSGRKLHRSSSTPEQLQGLIIDPKTKRPLPLTAATTKALTKTSFSEKTALSRAGPAVSVTSPATEHNNGSPLNSRQFTQDRMSSGDLNILTLNGIVEDEVVNGTSAPSSTIHLDLDTDALESSDNLEEIVQARRSKHRIRRHQSPSPLDNPPSNNSTLLDHTRSKQNGSGKDDSISSGFKDIVLCSDCQAWRRRVQELETTVETLTMNLSAREMEVATLRARIGENGRYVPKSEARLIQECESLRVTTEFLYQRLERYEHRDRKGDVH